MIDKDSNKSIRSTFRNMEVSEVVFFFYQTGSAWRHLLVIVQDEKRLIFIAGHERREERLHSIAFPLKYSLQPNTLWFFSDKKIFCQDQIVNRLNNCCLVLSPQNVLILMKTKNPICIMVFGVVTSDGDVIIFTNPSARAGYDTRSIFKRSLTGFNSEFVMPPVIFQWGPRINTKAYIVREVNAPLDREGGC